MARPPSHQALDEGRVRPEQLEDGLRLLPVRRQVLHHHHQHTQRLATAVSPRAGAGCVVKACASLPACLPDVPPR